MLFLVFNSIRCLTFTLLLFAGVSGRFNIDLDDDDDIHTDAIVIADQTNSVSAIAPALEEYIAVSAALYFCLPTQAPVELTEPLAPQHTPGPALSPPQLVVPLRT
ncbi:MAG: hypothetical protein LAP21_19815 [Acidobacteriia bacterium]|nr:hypothetical protein [Terriglobia bacterium]